VTLPNASQMQIIDSEQDGEVVRVRLEREGQHFEIIGNLEIEGGVVTLYETHIDGPGPGVLGAGAIKALADHLMEHFDVDALEVYGGRRTTGAAKGRRPGRLHFRRR
jgi:hypothetical protein